MADVNKSVNIAINVVSDVGKKINAIGISFNMMAGKVNFATDSIEKFRKQLGKIKAPAGIDKIAKGIQSISKVDSKGVDTLADGLKKIDKLKFPDFSKANSDLSAHNKALREVIKSYKELVSQSKKVKLQGIVKNVKQGSKAMKDFSTETKKSGTSFSQWGFALGSASTGLSKFGTQIYGVTRGFSAVSKELTASMIIFSTAFAGMFALKGVVNDLVAFDDAIRAAGAVAGASSTELEMFSDAAREMGESTRYTAVSAAEALKALAMTGLDVNESMATLPTVLNLAASANMDLGKSADIVTNIMVGYGKSVKDLPRIADLMTAAFTSSNTSLEQVGVALQYVGPVAKAAGIELEETVGILASLANAGYRGCYDRETDVLTEGGWKKWEDATEDDKFATYNDKTGYIEYQSPERMIRYRHTGKMYKVCNKGIDLCVTPDHRMYAKKRDHDNFEIIRANKLAGKAVRYKTGGMKWNGDSPDVITLPGFSQNRGSWTKEVPSIDIDSKLWATFLGWYIAEGHCNYDRGNYRVVITQKKPNHIKHMTEVFDALPWNYNHCKLTGQFTFTNEQFFRALKPLGQVYEKHIPSYAKKWDTDLLAILHKSLMDGDGTVEKRYYTSSIRLRDDVQEISLKLGYSTLSRKKTEIGDKSTINGREVTAKAVGWCINSTSVRTEPWMDRSNWNRNGDRKLSEKDPYNLFEGWIDYDDEVFCAEVPNGLLIVRRNGRAIVSGNSKAGTTLRTSIARLLAPTDKMKGVLEKYGIAMEQLVNEDGTMKSFTGMLDIMRTKSVTAGDALVLFGKRAGPGMLALMGQTAEEIDAMNTAISESKGIALKVAYEMESGLGGSLRKLKSMWEEVSIAIGKVIEKDVNGFVLDLTKTLKDNKDELVAVTAALFRFLGVLAKVGGWVAGFVAGNARLLASLGAIAIAIRLLTVEAKTLLGVNLLGMFTTLSSGTALKGFTGLIGKLTTSLNLYTSSATGAAVASSKLAKVGGVSAALGMATKNSLSFGSSLVLLAKSVGAAITGFIRLHPWLIVIAATIGALYAINKLVSKDYAEMAQESIKAANGAKELNRHLEYQLAKLGLINKQLEKDSAKGYEKSQSELVDVINSTNLSLEDKIDLIFRVNKSQDEAKKVQKELNEQIQKESDAYNIDIIRKAIDARNQQAKAGLKVAKDLDIYYGIVKDGESTLNDGEKALKGWITKLRESDGTISNAAIGVIDYLNEIAGAKKTYLENEKELDKMTAKYSVMERQMALTGKSAEEFEKALRLSGSTEQEIQDALNKYKDLVESIEDPKTKEAVEQALKIDTTEIENTAKEVVQIYKNMDKDILESHKQSNANIAILQAQGVLSLTDAELEKIRVYNETYQKRLTLAREKEAEIGATSEEQRKKIADAIKDIENDALAHTKDQLVKYITAEKDATEKILKIKKKQAEDEIALEEKKTSLITSSANKIANLRTSLADKTRAISQKGMTDEQKNNSNRIAANNKMIAAYKLLDEFERTGDSSTLSRLQSLVGSAGDLYGNLENSKEAYQGIGIASKTLEKIEKTRLNFELAKTEEIARKKKEKTDKELADQQKIKDASIAAVKSITELIDKISVTDKEFKIIVDSDEVMTAKEIMDEIEDKRVELELATAKEENFREINDIYGKLQDKTITLTIKTKVEGKGASIVRNEAEGGYITPSFFAKGGDVFRKLLSPFISSGSGNKDDVPAMLMKGEYVQTQSAVRKYGTAFMDSIRSGAFPLELALSGIKGFANGGSVFSGVGSSAPTPSLSSDSNENTMSVDLNLLPNEPPISTNMSGSQVNELFRQMSIMKNRLS